MLQDSKWNAESCSLPQLAHFVHKGREGSNAFLFFNLLIELYVGMISLNSLISWWFLKVAQQLSSTSFQALIFRPKLKIIWSNAISALQGDSCRDIF